MKHSPFFKIGLFMTLFLIFSYCTNEEDLFSYDIEKAYVQSFFDVEVLQSSRSIDFTDKLTLLVVNTLCKQENLIDAIWGLYYSGDKSIENVEIPDVTTEIRPSAFLNCEKIKLTKLPKNLKKIGDSAFENCTRIEITQIPSACTSIGKAAFKKM